MFAENRVVIVPAGIGTLAPRDRSSGRIARARCYGDLVTLDPSGVVLVRPSLRLSLASLFRSWGEPLSRSRLASFAAPHAEGVLVFLGGRRWHGDPGAVPLTPHAEIVLEAGPYVPPHTSFAFPRGE